MKKFCKWIFASFSLLFLLTLSACQKSSKSLDTYTRGAS